MFVWGKLRPCSFPRWVWFRGLCISIELKTGFEARQTTLGTFLANCQLLTLRFYFSLSLPLEPQVLG